MKRSLQNSLFMRKNALAWLAQVICLIFIAYLLLVPVCGDVSNTDEAAWPRSVADDQGQIVTVAEAPVRIVSLAPSNTELLYALGLGDHIVGVTDYCNYPAEALLKDKIGGFSTVSIEKVVALKPDFVVAALGNNQAAIDRIKSLGIPVYFSDLASLTQIYSTLEKLGYLTGTGEKASALIAELKDREEGVRVEGAKLSEKPVVGHVIWHEPIYISGGGTFQDELIRIAGGINGFADKEGHQIISVEEFVNINPDILMINSGSGMGGDATSIATYLKTEPRLSGVHAIATDRIIMIDSDIADRAGPRLWDLLEEIAPKIRGE